MGELYLDNFERLSTPDHAAEHGRHQKKANISVADERLQCLIVWSLPLKYDDDDQRESLLSGAH